jgi:uncharacterized protein YndB with AHSA1/START domain
VQSPRGTVSERAVLQKTGRGFDHWFAVLDDFATRSKGHTAAADHLYSAHAVPGWYAQGITVTWERARGLRAPNQSCTGTFQVSVSRVVPASVAEVARALSEPPRRARWLRGADPALVKALNAAFTGPQPRTVTIKNAGYARMRYPWDGGTVEIYIYAKPRGASVVASNTDLTSPALVETRREQWRTALDSLKEHLAG